MDSRCSGKTTFGLLPNNVWSLGCSPLIYAWRNLSPTMLPKLAVVQWSSKCVPYNSRVTITSKVVRNANPHPSPIGSETLGCSPPICVILSHTDNYDASWSLRTTALFEAPSTDFYSRDSGFTGTSPPFCKPCCLMPIGWNICTVSSPIGIAAYLCTSWVNDYKLQCDLFQMQFWQIVLIITIM